MRFSALDIAPVVETPRLRLRPHTLDDYEHVCRLWGDEEVGRYTGGRPQSREEAWHRLLRYNGMWRLIGIGHFAVEEKATGAFIGETGVMDARREIDPPLGDVPEIGWAFMPSAHGKGYASEAVGAVLDWCDKDLKADIVVCIIDPQNARSFKLAEKCGFRRRGPGAYHGHATIQLERRRAT